MKAIKDKIKGFLKTYKDVVFVIIASLWLASNIIEYLVWGTTFWANNFYIVFMCIMILVKIRSERFNNWLDTRIQ